MRLKSIIILSGLLSLSACSAPTTKNILGKPDKGYKSVAATTPPLVIPHDLETSRFKSSYALPNNIPQTPPPVSIEPPGSHLDQYRKADKKQR